MKRTRYIVYCPDGHSARFSVQWHARMFAIALSEREPDLLIEMSARDGLIGDAPPEVQAELRALDTDLRDLLIRLSIAMWDRKDAASVAVAPGFCHTLPIAAPVHS